HLATTGQKRRTKHTGQTDTHTSRRDEKARWHSYPGSRCRRGLNNSQKCRDTPWGCQDQQGDVDMALIRIQERTRDQDGSNAIVSFDHGPEYPITISDAFTEKEEQELEWYFEEHLAFPFTNK